MIHAALFFAVLTPLVVGGLIVFAIALGKAAGRGDQQSGSFDAQYRSRVGLSEQDVALCQSRQRSRHVSVMAGVCGLTPDLVSKRGRGAETPDRPIEERKLPDDR